MRKVRPLVEVLHGLDAWITGLRRDRWATRSNIRKIGPDHDHGDIVKVNPLADWTDEEVWDYVRANDVPYPLYDQGYRSIGCASCTRPVEPGRTRVRADGGGRRTVPRNEACTVSWKTGGFEHEIEDLVNSNQR